MGHVGLATEGGGGSVGPAHPLCHRKGDHELPYPAGVGGPENANPVLRRAWRLDLTNESPLNPLPHPLLKIEYTRVSVESRRGLEARTKGFDFRRRNGALL
eukprot:1056517-Prorocentrum_minimum.AAC.1